MHCIPRNIVKYLTYNKLMKLLKVMIAISKSPLSCSKGSTTQSFLRFQWTMEKTTTQLGNLEMALQCCLLSYGARSEVPLRRSWCMGNPIRRSASRPIKNLWTPSVRSRKDPEGLGPAPVPGLTWDVADFVKSFREYGSSAKGRAWGSNVRHISGSSPDSVIGIWPRLCDVLIAAGHVPLQVNNKFKASFKASIVLRKQNPKESYWSFNVQCSLNNQASLNFPRSSDQLESFRMLTTECTLWIGNGHLQHCSYPGFPLIKLTSIQ